jgi:hypothetical protein
MFTFQREESGSFSQVFYVLHFWCSKEVLETKSFFFFFPFHQTCFPTFLSLIVLFFISHKNSNGFLLLSGSLRWRQSNREKTIKNLCVFLGAYETQSVSDKGTKCSQYVHKKALCVLCVGRGSGSAGGK